MWLDGRAICIWLKPLQPLASLEPLATWFDMLLRSFFSGSAFLLAAAASRSSNEFPTLGEEQNMDKLVLESSYQSFQFSDTADNLLVGVLLFDDEG